MMHLIARTVQAYAISAYTTTRWVRRLTFADAKAIKTFRVETVIDLPSALPNPFEVTKFG